MVDIAFSFSDMIAGYCTGFDRAADSFGIRTSDGREFTARLTQTTFAELVRNLGEAYVDCTGQMREMLVPDRFLFTYGVFYPEPGKPFEAKTLVFAGRTGTEFVFEQQNWWIRQIRQLAQFFLRAQFGGADGTIDINYHNYRTTLTADGTRTNTFRQECDTISRLVYGFASAFMLTGEDRFLEAAEVGTAYLRDHFRASDPTSGTSYWYHAIDVNGARVRKVLASEFGDDFDAIPAYEQIYALAGPVQTFRATGDSRILADAHATMTLFDRYFHDPEQGGYWSHIDPVTFNGQSETLGRNRARKNWNSVGDHAPAYLINLWLGTGGERERQMLEDCADLITTHFPDYEHSAFVNEKFHGDWSHDQSWGWQQNRAVVGHNLKIAWNLMRIASMKPDKGYVALAERIAELMPAHGMDKQRMGWYDVVERVLAPGETEHRFAWHDRKAWWQQEQGILAYMILSGVRKDPQYLKYARESAAFYNAWFLDHDAGGVYFNVLANGLPYMMGTERMKGSHSMSGYHSFELCYLAAVYGNLLMTRQPLDLYFRPFPKSYGDGVLRVAPDILPAGSVRIESVSIDGLSYDKFDAEALTVTLPDTTDRVKVHVRLVPTSGVEHFTITSEAEGRSVTLTLCGQLDERGMPAFRAEMARLLAAAPTRVVFDVGSLTLISAGAVRELAMVREKLDLDEDLRVAGASPAVREQLDLVGFGDGVTFI
ncbi:STAS domain-containing protein [Rhodovastum atsumiense]|uniref:STAS domain-containing protein n=1 Tax=Rhodovastum atsumiense TaxID=504468 RepID=A0A5M6IM73_9PROT|nr:AGE family epimerase/isomerase [Rhodovastum atsumiense]KAA5609332.1 STAS domain-containing protein [Rhodovastum atsumiense]CAH2602367.1 STAS domain-containing protein [Rhodovastum atsumiense]